MPASAVILGGGVIGVEFASAWRSFGAEVTIVEALPHLLPGEEESSSRWLQRAFGKRGIGFELGAKLENVKDDGDGITVTLEGGKTLEAQLLLVAVGASRSRPGSVSRRLVATEHGFVTVDEHCQTGVPTISAVGDLTRGPQLAHVGFAQGILAAEKIAGLPVTAIDYDGVPRITYSDPEVASVGLTSATAAARGIETVQVRYPLGANGRSVILQTQGEARVIAAAPADGDASPDPCSGPPRGRTGRRANRREPADLQLESGASRRRPADPPAPHPVRDDRRSAPRAGRQAPPLPWITGRKHGC